MKEASLWVNLSRCETGGPVRSSVISHPWRPAPCLARTEELVLREPGPWPQTQAPLTPTNSLRKQARCIGREDERSRQMGARSGARERGDSQWRSMSDGREKEAKTGRRTDYLSILKQSWKITFRVSELEILANIALVICCRQRGSFLCTVVVLLTYFLTHRSICSACRPSCLASTQIIDWCTTNPLYGSIHVFADPFPSPNQYRSFTHSLFTFTELFSVGFVGKWTNNRWKYQSPTHPKSTSITAI